MARPLNLLDSDQHEEASRAGHAELEAALERRTQEERDAFWKALDLYDAPPPEVGSDQCEPLRQSPVQSGDAGGAALNVGSLHGRLILSREHDVLNGATDDAA